MSTRALITTSENEVAIYKHYDGYPSEVVPFLHKFCGEFTRQRRFFDPSYMLARLIQAMANESDHRYGEGLLGFGLVAAESDCGQEWNYTITEKSIDVVSSYPSDNGLYTQYIFPYDTELDTACLAGLD